MVAMVADEDHMTLEVPQPFEQFPAYLDGLVYKIECHGRTGGTIVYYPASIAYGDGI